MVRGIAGRRKRYVEVEAEFLADGTVVPRAVLGRRRCASLKVGGEGVRYDVVVGNAHTFLFHEDPRWFVEEIVPEPSPEDAGASARCGDGAFGA